MVVLIDAEPGAGALDPDAATTLAGLGVTNVTVVYDDVSLGVVLEGWAFDPASAGEEAAAIVASGRRGVRTLRPLMQTAVCTEQRAAAGERMGGTP